MKISNRLNIYFKGNLENFVFDEMSEAALIRMNVLDILKDIPVPLQEEDIRNIGSGEGITSARLAVNMAYIIGCDPQFKFAAQYLEFMDRLFRGEMYGGIIKAAEAEADTGQLESACVYFRAALVLKEDSLKAMYGYAMACRELYIAASKVGDESEKDDEYIGRFKAECIEILEIITMEYPDFAEPHYFLGYAYLNLGLYVKADLAFRDFLGVATDAEQKREVRERREQLEAPVKIEQGINHIVCGRFHEGAYMLEQYVGSEAADKWWPLYYYLGFAYLRIGMQEKGIESLKRSLKLNGSHIDSMEELLWAYEELGDSENVEKYSRKIELIKGYEAEDRKNN